jgi:fibronectin-binding autotransporter adhesin
MKCVNPNVRFKATGKNTARVGPLILLIALGVVSSSFLISPVKSQGTVVIKDQTSCSSIGGGWTTSTCDLPTSYTIESGDVLEAAAGITLSNAGTLEIYGTLVNYGTVTNNQITFNGVTSQGTINNENGGTISNNGDFDNYGYAVTNAGTLDNYGTFVNEGGLFDNGGTIANQNHAIFTNTAGVLTNEETGKIVNMGNFNAATSASTLDNYGHITNTGSIVIAGLNSALGQLNNYATGSIENSAGAQMANWGALNNAGVIDNNGTFANFVLVCNAATCNGYTSTTTGMVTVSGRIVNNAGAIIYTNSTITVPEGGRIEDNGTVIVDSGGTITLDTGGLIAFDPGGVILLKSGGTISVETGVTLKIYGSVYIFGDLEFFGSVAVNNYGTLTVESGTTLTVGSGSTIYNYKTIDNEGTVQNQGTIYNECGAMINGGVSGNQVIYITPCGTSTTTTSSTSSTTSTTSTSTTSTTRSTSTTTTTAPTTSNTGGGGVPEFPFQLIATPLLVVIIVFSYLVVRRHQSAFKGNRVDPH